MSEKLFCNLYKMVKLEVQINWGRIGKIVEAECKIFSSFLFLIKMKKIIFSVII